MAKQLNARVQTKRDTEQNWNQAINFIPKDGEIIIYKADTTAEELQTFYEAYLAEVEALKLITNTSSTEYQEQLKSPKPSLPTIIALHELCRVLKLAMARNI